MTTPTTVKPILGYGVYYVPSKEGKIFAGLKAELQEAFEKQDDAIRMCNEMEITGAYDELHIGYRVYPMNWIPNGVTFR